MQNQKNDVIVKSNVYIEGVGFIGVATYTSPELKFKRVECSGAAGSYKKTYGAIEELEASAKVTITNKVLYKAAAKLDDINIIFSKALSTDDGAKARRDVLKGSFDIKENESKDGEVYEIELNIFAHYWLKELAGKPMVEIDKQKDIVRIDGKDLLEETRKVVEG